MNKLQPNENQQQAITHGEGPLLIVAGAGTGKTRVITERIAHLVLNERAKVNEILALTFTEKAAQEMEERVDVLLPYGYVDTWISTFHSFCDKVLKRHALDIGLNPNYKLIDETAAWLMIRKNLKRFPLDYYRPMGYPTKYIHALLKHFSRCKDEGILAADYLKYAEELKLNTDNADFIKELEIKDVEDKDEMVKQEILRINEIAEAYHVYQQLLLENNFLDFADLIIYTLKLLKERPLILNYYRQRFKYILVDEYQDTNYIQNELIKLLAAPKNNLTVVGDDDQSIYRFRGSSIENIMEFMNDFPDAKKVVLTKNYRSAQEVLDKSYQFIKQNDPHRLEVTLNIDKKLQSESGITGAVEHLHFDTVENEALGVINKIVQVKKLNNELTWSDFAILVRANDSAERFINALNQAQIPNQFLSLRGLYNKPLILDVVSYFKLLDNYHENRAIFRVLNLPFSRVSYADLILINNYSSRKAISLYETLKQITLVPNITDATVKAANNLISMIAKHTAMVKDKKASEIMYDFLYSSGYVEFLKDKNDKEHFEALRQADQFYQKIKNLESEGEIDGLKDFVELFDLELEAGETGALRLSLDEGPDMVRILTVHSAKGLEFKYVFIVNLVDRKFPTDERRDPIRIPEALLREKLPVGDFHIEEERRLFYVAMTRAKQGLYFTSADDYGGARAKKLSRFLVELGYVSQENKKAKKQESNSMPEKIATKKDINFEIEVPKKFSFSSLSMYSKCPYQFYLGKILGLPTPTKYPLVFGDAVHRTLKDFVEQSALKVKIQAGLFDSPESEKPQIMSLPDLKELFKKYWVEDWFHTAEQRQEYFDLAMEIMTNFHADFSATPPNVMHLEVPFSINLGQYKINGRIDRIDEVDGGVEIIDYKTGQAKGDDMSPEDKQQVLLYQIVAEEVLHVKPVKLTYYYLNDSKRVTFLGNEKQKDKLKQDWLEIIDQIHKRQFTATPNEFACTFCDFKSICEFRKL